MAQSLNFLDPIQFHSAIVGGCRLIKSYILRLNHTNFSIFAARDVKLNILQSLKSYAKRNPIDVSIPILSNQRTTVLTFKNSFQT